ncbi:LytR family transcriptional regulator [Patescibacteria group bacterium]|nr:MAG: LytR family transcriptional regulator [Patescibacteria group bacterium]
MEKNTPFEVKQSPIKLGGKKPRKWLRVVLIIACLLLAVGGTMAFKMGMFVNSISTKGNIFKSLTKSLPGASHELKGQADDRVNVLLLGMRGAEETGGGLLADTIMVVSIKPSTNQVSMISIPRDLTVQVPNNNFQSKINAVHFYGEDQGGAGKGLTYMEQVVGDVAGIPIHYAVSINFKGFRELVDVLGGVDVTLKEPFAELLQFHEPHVCDPYVFTIPTGKYEMKYDHKGRVKVGSVHPLCYNKNPECGGSFELPAGTNHLDGEKALCYARARFSSNDFERAARQQLVIEAIKQKALSVGTLSDFGKVSAVMDSLGQNMKTDMEAWEMKEFFALYQKMPNPTTTSRVLQDSEEGLLYAAPQTPELGYHLLPRGDNYDRIQALFQNVFSVPAQK